MDVPTFITFMVMFMLLFFGMLIIFLTYRHNRHVIDLNHKERMSALERSLDVPSVSATSEGVQRGSVSVYYLHRGLLFTLLGVSLMTAVGVNAGAKSALWGLPVTAFGIAYLVLYVMVGRREKRT